VACMGNNVQRLQEKTLIKSQYKVEKTYFWFISCAALFLHNIEDWWVKDFRHIYCNMIANLFGRKSPHSRIWKKHLWLEILYNLSAEMLSIHAESCSNLQTKTSSNGYEYRKLCMHEVIFNSSVQIVLYMENVTLFFNVFRPTL
jgi:hypothetical protein